MNEKRDQVRMEIRKAQKQSLFQEIRAQLLIETQNTKINPIEQLTNGRNQAISLQILDSRIKSTKGNVILQMMDQGCFFILIENLKTDKFIQETLKIITSILSKQQILVGNILVSRGLIELLLKYITNIDYFKYCCNILGNLAIEDQNFAELMLENKVYHNVIEVIRKIQISNIKHFQNQMQFGIWCIVNMVSKMDQDYQFEPHLDQLISFVNYFLLNELYIQETLELLYQIATHNISQAKNSTTVSLIQKLLVQASQDTPYLRNLLYVLYITSPLIMDYRPLFSLIVLRPKFISISLRIMNKLVGHPDLVKPIANDTKWINKLCSLVVSQQDKINLLKIMSQLPDNEQTWETVRQFLDPNQSIRHQLQGLKFMNEYIKRSNGFDESFLKFLQSKCIMHYLQLLSECKNTVVQKKAQQILQILTNA